MTLSLKLDNQKYTVALRLISFPYWSYMDCTVLFVQKLMVIVKDKPVGGGGEEGNTFQKKCLVKLASFYISINDHILDMIHNKIVCHTGEKYHKLSTNELKMVFLLVLYRKFNIQLKVNSSK